MANPYLGQIEAFSFDFPPRGWAVCAGQLMAITTNQALFSVLGTTFGGDGVRTFALPDLRGRVAVGQGTSPEMGSVPVGAKGGEENHALTLMETPSHGHGLGVSAKADTANNTYVPAPNSVLTKTTGQDADGNPLTFNIYTPDNTPTEPLYPSTIGETGGQPHSNMMPYLGLNFCIAVHGIFPSRT